MREQLTEAYQKKLLTLFKDTKTHFSAKEFGADKMIITSTIPFMILENWRESGHQNEIPLLDECVRNIVIATASVIFGWKKTSFLHLRVSLESIFYGINLMSNKKDYLQFMADGTIQYRKLKDLLNSFVRISPISSQIEANFNVTQEITDMYDKLSRWTHSLGNEYFADLSILNKIKLTPKSIGEIKSAFRVISKYAPIIYLTVKPDLLSDLCPSDQRRLLQSLSLSEKKTFRGLINV